MRHYVGASISQTNLVPHICLLGKATGDPAYTTLGELGDICVEEQKKTTTQQYKQSVAKKDYDAYASKLRRELVWQGSFSCAGQLCRGHFRCTLNKREPFPRSQNHLSESDEGPNGTRVHK